MNGQTGAVMRAIPGLPQLPGKKDLLDRRKAPASERPFFQRGKIIACIDGSSPARKVIAHAQAIGLGLNAPVALAQVLESAGALEGPQDPLDWSSRRRRCAEHLKWLAQREFAQAAPIEDILLEGRAADELASWTAANDTILLALATHGEDRSRRDGLGSTAQKLLDLAPGSLLLVPPGAVECSGYKRILVPLDGSRRAESALPFAVAIARTYGSEVLLAHVVPQPQLTEVGPLEQEAVSLQQQLIRRNEQVARTYLQRMTARLVQSQVRVQTILKQGDARESLRRLALDEGADLVIVSAQGHSGRADVSYGNVTAYLASHMPVPLLIVRGMAAERQAASTKPMIAQPAYLQ